MFYQHSSFCLPFPLSYNQEEPYVCAEMAVAIFLSRLAVTWLIVPKQLDNAIVIFNDSA